MRLNFHNLSDLEFDLSQSSRSNVIVPLLPPICDFLLVSDSSNHMFISQCLPVRATWKFPRTLVIGPKFRTPTPNLYPRVSFLKIYPFLPWVRDKALTKNDGDQLNSFWVILFIDWHTRTDEERHKKPNPSVLVGFKYTDTIDSGLYLHAVIYYNLVRENRLLDSGFILETIDFLHTESWMKTK